jgi:hypothetical protein
MARQPLGVPDPCNYGQKCEVRIGDSPDLEPGPRQMIPELRPTVSTAFASEHRVVAGQGFQRGNIDQDLSSGPQHPIHLTERVALHLVVESVEDVKRGDEIELTAGEGQAGGGGLGDLAFALLPGVGEPTPRDVDAARAPVAPQQGQVVPGPAPAVEDASPAQAADRFSEDWFDKASEPPEPKVFALGERGRFEESVH